MDNNGTYHWTPGDQTPKQPIQWKKFGKTVLMAAIALAVAVGVLTCFYTVDEFLELQKEELEEWKGMRDNV